MTETEKLRAQLDLALKALEKIANLTDIPFEECKSVTQAAVWRRKFDRELAQEILQKIRGAA